MPNNSLEPSSELYLCPACGAFISKFAERCPNCGIDLTETEEEEDLEVIEPKDNLFVCQDCGAFIGVDAKTCSACGAKRAPHTATVDVAQDDFKPEDPTVDYLEHPTDLFTCGNCGAFLSSTSLKCEICGAVMEEDEEEEQEISEVVEAEEPEVSMPLESQGAIVLCVNCGAFVSGDADECKICGNPMGYFEEEEESLEMMAADGDSLDEMLYSSGALCLCENCGAFISPDAEICEKCNESVIEGIEAEQMEAVEALPKEVERPRVRERVRAKEKPASEKVTLPKEKKKFKRKGRAKVSKVPKKPKKISIKDQVQLLYKDALIFYSTKRYNEAIRTLDQILELKPDDEGAIMAKGNIYYRTGDHISAAKYFKQILQKNPESADLWNRLGNTFNKMNQQRQSLICFNRALKLKPNFKEALINKGYLFMKHGKYDEALKCIYSYEKLT